MRFKTFAFLAIHAVLSGSAAEAQSTIKTPLDRSSYAVEIEPHLDVGTFDPLGYGSGLGYGLGGRVSFEVVRNGFVPSINDSVDIGVGADFLHYQGSGVTGAGSRCAQYVNGPAGTMVCRQTVTPGGASNYAFIPVVMQWNFWLARKWSVFGEPGLSLYAVDYNSFSVSPVFYAGGRYHFTDTVTLTVRVGYPTASIGVSFLL